MRSPADGGGHSWSPGTVRSGKLTAMSSGGVVGLPSLVVVTLAVLVTVPEPVAQLAGVFFVVGLVMWPETVAPEARSVPGPPKCSASFEVAQAAAVELLSLHDALPICRVSLSVTSWAMPGPLLWTVTV